MLKVSTLDLALMSGCVVDVEPSASADHTLGRESSAVKEVFLDDGDLVSGRGAVTVVATSSGSVPGGGWGSSGSGGRSQRSEVLAECGGLGRGAGLGVVSGFGGRGSMVGRWAGAEDLVATFGGVTGAGGSVIVSRGTSLGRLAGLACLVLLLAGCAGGPAGEDEGIPQLSLSPVSAASPAGSAPGSGPAREQQIAAGAEAIRAYRQMIFDIYADPSPNVQDMRKVATGELLAGNIRYLQQQLDVGWTNTPGTVSVKWVKPVSVGKEEMRLYACVDPNGILTGMSDRPTARAKAEAIDYVLTATSAGWLVSGTFTNGGARSVQPC